MSYETLTYEVKQKVAYVTFNTPDQLNSITEQRMTELEAVMAELKRDAQVNAAVLTGSGKAFCVGLDLELLKKAFEDIDYFGGVIKRLNAILFDIERLPIPVIAAVNGFARAGGFEIALACDIMLIAEEAKIGDNHSHVHVMPGGGSTQRLPRRIGAQRAKELIWTARWLTGREAVDYGLALRAVPRDQLQAAVEELVAQLRDKVRPCLAVIKDTMREGAPLPIEDAVAVEMRNFVRYMGDEPYAREGFWESLKAAGS